MDPTPRKGRDPMTIKEALIRAVAEKNAKRAGDIVTVLRFRAGMNYDQILAFAGVPADEFEDLMAEADELESEASS